MTESNNYRKTDYSAYKMKTGYEVDYSPNNSRLYECICIVVVAALICLLII